MQKTTLILDQRKLKRARTVLGTKGIRDTVDRALDEVLAVEARRRLLRRLMSGEGTDLANDQIMAQAWR